MKQDKYVIQALAAGRGKEALRLVGYSDKEADREIERLVQAGLVDRRYLALTRKGQRVAQELGPIHR